MVNNVINFELEDYADIFYVIGQIMGITFVLLMYIGTVLLKCVLVSWAWHAFCWWEAKRHSSIISNGFQSAFLRMVWRRTSNFCTTKIAFRNIEFLFYFCETQWNMKSVSHNKWIATVIFTSEHFKVTQ